MKEQPVKIFVVEDDPNLGVILTEYLEAKGYKTLLATDGEEGVWKYEPRAFDILIFDVMLPKKDGFTMAREIKEKDPEHPPIIFLTAKSQKEDRLEGFRAGADDYLTKPFSMEELGFRINAILRRAGKIREGIEVTSNRFDIGNYDFDSSYRRLTFPDGQELSLSTKEAQLLRLLCLYKNRILPREEALNKIWGEHHYFTARSMDVYITKLRKYLKDDPSIRIMNVHGQGYKMMVGEGT